MLSLAIAALSLSSSATSGEIAFLRATGPDQRRVCIVNLSTGEVADVGPGPWDGAPVWSADGQKLAFTHVLPSGRTAILVCNAAGETLFTISAEGRNCTSPAWSPSGQLLAYTSETGTASRIWVHDISKNAATQWGTEERDAMAPSWKSETELVGVGLIKEEGKGLTTDLFDIEPGSASLLATTRGNGFFVEWQPVFQTVVAGLAYESNDGGDREIFVELPRRGVVDVSNHRAPDWNPVWSPDGAWIAFESLRGGTRGIYRVTPQRIIVTPIAADATSENWAPSWSPSGSSLVFVSTRGGKPALYVCDVEGDNMRAVTTPDFEDLAPAWRPETAEQ